MDTEENVNKPTLTRDTISQKTTPASLTPKQFKIYPVIISIIVFLLFFSVAYFIIQKNKITKNSISIKPTLSPNASSTTSQNNEITFSNYQYTYSDNDKALLKSVQFPQNSVIAYVKYSYNLKSTNEVWVADINGNKTKLIWLDDYSYQINNLTWSPKGNQILFTLRMLDNSVSGKWDGLYLYECDKNIITKISNFGLGTDPVWSSDGNYLAFLNDPSSGYGPLYIYDVLIQKYKDVINFTTNGIEKQLWWGTNNHIFASTYLRATYCSYATSYCPELEKWKTQAYSEIFDIDPIERSFTKIVETHRNKEGSINQLILDKSHNTLIYNLINDNPASSSYVSINLVSKEQKKLDSIFSYSSMEIFLSPNSDKFIYSDQGGERPGDYILMNLTDYSKKYLVEFDPEKINSSGIIYGWKNNNSVLLSYDNSLWILDVNTMQKTYFMNTDSSNLYKLRPIVE